MTRLPRGVNVGMIGFMKHGIRIYDDTNENREDDLLPEYDFDGSEAKYNPYAAQAARRQSVRSIILEADIAEVFTTSEQVNKALRALIEAVPTRPSQDKAI